MGFFGVFVAVLAALLVFQYGKVILFSVLVGIGIIRIGEPEPPKVKIRDPWRRFFDVVAVLALVCVIYFGLSS